MRPPRLSTTSLLAAAVGLACSNGTPPIAHDQAAAASPPTPAPAASSAKVILEGSAGAAPVAVEVVATPATIERGLMYRQHLPPDSGMLFLMGARRDHTFWMRNTLIPLDMIFIDQDRRVVGVVENTEPRTDTPRSVGQPSLYVLEVNGGWAGKHGVAAGATVRFEGIPQLAR